MKTLTGILYESLLEDFSSGIIKTLYKNNRDVMSQLFRSLAKYRYSFQGLTDEFIITSSVSDALKHSNFDIVKIWMSGSEISAVTVGNYIVDTNFTWNTKPKLGAVRDTNNLIGNQDHTVSWIKNDNTFAKKQFTECYMIALSSFKALGVKSSPSEVPTVSGTIEKYKINPKYNEFVSNDSVDAISDKWGKLIAVHTQNTNASTYYEYTKGDIILHIRNTDKKLFRISSIKKSYFKDRWGVKTEGTSDKSAVEIDINGNDISKEISMIYLFGNDKVVARSLSDFKKDKFFIIKREQYNTWDLMKVGGASNTPSKNSSIASFEDAKIMFFSSTPIIFGTSPSSKYKEGEFILYVNDALLDKFDIDSIKDVINKKSQNKIVAEANLYVAFGKGLLIKFEDKIVPDIQYLEPMLNSILKNLSSDIEYHTFYYDSIEQIRLQKKLKDDEAKAKADLLLAKAQEKKAIRSNLKNEEVKAKNAEIQKAQSKVDTEVKHALSNISNYIDKSIMPEIVKNAQTWDDVERIWRTHLNNLSKFVNRSNIDTLDNVPINTSGLYYAYPRSGNGSLYDLSIPYGAPGVSYKKSYAIDSTKYQREFFEKWLKTKSIDKSEQWKVTPSIAIVCSNGYIICSSRFPGLVGGNFLFSTNNGTSSSGTVALKFTEYKLVKDCTGGSFYTFK